MSILEELQIVLGSLPAPIETGVFSEKALDEYLVLVPLTDSFALHGDNAPLVDVQEVLISIYTKGSYTKLKNAVVRKLLSADFTVTARQYIGYETETGYHHYNVDTAKHYEYETEE
mgnify:FL=1